MITYLLRIQFFGKKKYFYTLDEIWPENKIGKWTLILITNYIFYIIFILLSYYLYYLFDFIIFLLNEFFLSLVIILFLKIGLNKYFPKDRRGNWSLKVPVFLTYSYVLTQILLLNTVISFSIGYVIFFAFFALTGCILIFKHILNPRKRVKNKVRKVRTATLKKKGNKKDNWMFLLLILSTLFFIISFIPRFFNFISLEYLPGFFLILLGVSLIPIVLNGKKKHYVKKSEKIKLDRNSKVNMDFNQIDAERDYERYKERFR
jgi:hypothetical protein